MATMEYYGGGKKRKIRFQRLFASEEQEIARRLRSFRTMEPTRPQHDAQASMNNDVSAMSLVYFHE